MGDNIYPTKGRSALAAMQKRNIARKRKFEYAIALARSGAGPVPAEPRYEVEPNVYAPRSVREPVLAEAQQTEPADPNHPLIPR